MGLQQYKGRKNDKGFFMSVVEPKMVLAPDCHPNESKFSASKSYIKNTKRSLPL